MFSIDTYNSLPSIQKGAGVFDDQLKSSGLTVRTLLDELEPLFSGGDNAGRYGIWILHRHFRLETGERMVAKGDLTEPTTDISSLIVAERWNAKGEELEHRHVDDTHGVPPAPSPEFMSAFNAIMEAKKIDCLGVCFAPTTQEKEKLQEGYVFLETTDHHEGGRKHVLNLVPADDLRTNGETTFKSCWTVSGPQDYQCSHTCKTPQCPPPKTPLLESFW